MPLSPNMNLPIPVPSQTGGPQYALDEQSCFQQLDSHNHTPGQGVQIPVNALDINQNLSMGGLSVTDLKSVKFENQSISPGSSSLYMLGNDLYWSDGTGAFNVQITSGNAVAVSGAVGFSGLPSGTASAAFLSFTGTFRFQSATNTGATLDVGPIKTRNTTASSNAVTITPPNPLPADYTLTLPNALPTGNSFIKSDNSGNLSFQSTDFLLPAGVMMMYGGTSVPTGWLFCDGSVVSQAAYANLYAVVGTAFDTGGEGAGNFRLPNFQRRVPMGAGGTVPAGAVVPANTIGSSGGTETVTLTTSQMPAHTHTTTNSGTAGGAYTNPALRLTWTSDSSFINTYTTSSTGGGSAHSNTQPSLVVNYIIKY